MSLKIGASNYDYFYGNNSLEKPANTASATQDGKSQNLPVVPDEGYYTVGGSDDTEYDAAYRALMNAARRAAIADPKAQARFAENVIGKPTEENRKSFQLLHTKNQQDITDAEFDRMKGQTNSLILSKQDIASLRQFRQQYIDDGGRILSRREIAPQITPAEKQLVAHPAYSTDANAAVNNAGKVEGITDLNAPNTFKIRVTLPSKDSPFAKESLADQALLGYAQQEFGRPKTNLMGDNILNIRDDAKLAGVNIKVLTDTLKPLGNRESVVIEMTFADKQKIKNLYIKEQAQVNKEIEAVKNAVNKTVAQSFMRGFFKGAWNDLKSNGEILYELGKAVADPFGTANKIGAAIAEMPKFGARVVNGISAAASELAKMTPAQMEAFAKELISKGVKDLENLEGSALFEKLGEIAGTVAMEVVLFKGVSAGSKLAYEAFKATNAGTDFIKAAETVGQAMKSRVANFISDEAAALAEKRFFARAKELGLSPNSITNIAVDPELWKNMTQIAANAIGKGYVKFGEFSKQMVNALGESVKPHLEKLYRESLISLDLNKGKQILSNSGKVIDQAIVREAKEKVVQLVQENKVAELKEYLYEIGNKYGTDFQDELKQTVGKTVDGVFEGRRTPEVYDMLGGHTIYDLFDGQIDTKHVGKTVEQLRERLLREKNIRFASSFKDLDTANRAQMQFIKHYEKEIADWLKNGAIKPFENSLELGTDLGNIVGRGKFGTKAGTKVQVILAKDETKQGWHVVTSFPVL